MTRMMRFIRGLLIYYFTLILSRLSLPRNKGAIPTTRVKRILVYGQMGIGNMIMFTPFLKALRNLFPNSEITLLFWKRNGAEQVVSGSNLVDKILILDYENLNCFKKLQAILQTIKYRPDLIIARFHAHHIVYVLTTVLSRAPYRVGHVSGGGWRGVYDYLYNYPVKLGGNEHEIDWYLRLSSKIGTYPIDKNPVFYISNEDEQSARVFLRVHDIKDCDQFVTIQVGTSLAQSWKRWNMEKWAKLTEILLQNNVKVVAVGSPEERDLIKDTFASLAIPPVVVAGELTLKQTAAVIKRSNLLICHDSGLMHVAVAMGTPVVAIYGPGDPIRTAPMDKKHVIIRKDLSCSPCATIRGTAKAEACQDRVCLNSISVEEVFEAVKRKLMV